MPRRQYPSDRRPYFRLLTEILDDPKLGECSADACWTYVRLLAMLQRTGSRTGIISLPKRSVCYLARRDRFPHGLKILRELELQDLCRLSAEPCRASADSLQTVVTVAKWPEIQGLATAKRGEERRGERESPPAPPAARPRARAGARKATPKTVCPEQLSDAQRDQVKAWRNRSHLELDDRELAAQWARFTDHYIGEGEKKADWVRTFYKWLTGPYYKRLTPSPCPGIQYVVRESPPDPPDPAELEAAIAESRAKRKGFRGGRLQVAAQGAG